MIPGLNGRDSNLIGTNFETALNILKQRVGQTSHQESIPQPSTSSQSQVETSSAIHPAVSSMPSIWEEFDKEVAALRPENSIAAGIVEVDRYIQEPMLSRQGNPLTWWHQRKEVYPHLFRYMLKRLHLLATSVPCERPYLNRTQVKTCIEKAGTATFYKLECPFTRR